MVPAWSLGFNIIVVHDAGESNFMKPVLADLLRGHHSDLTVFALGEPAISLFEEDSVFSEVLVTPDTLGLSTVILDGNDGRDDRRSVRRPGSALRPKGLLQQAHWPLGRAFLF